MNESLMRQCVSELARVKSEQNILGALGIYHPDATLVTVGLNVEAQGTADIEQQLRVFYLLCPDYQVELTQVACNDNALLAAGYVQLTPVIPGMTCKTVRQPAAFCFKFKEGRVFYEAFYLDFGQICVKAGISTAQLSKAISQYQHFVETKAFEHD